MITSQTSIEFEFPLSRIGLLLDFSAIRIDSANELNKFAFQHDTIWKTNKTRLLKSIYQNSIILNQLNSVTECCNSNIFLIKGNLLYSPSFETGCYIDNIREHVLTQAKHIGFKIIESNKIKTEDIFQMDEIFLASEESGFQWVLGIENKRFIRKFTNEIHSRLNQLLKTMAESV